MKRKNESHSPAAVSPSKKRMTFAPRGDMARNEEGPMSITEWEERADRGESPVGPMSAGMEPGEKGFGTIPPELMERVLGHMNPVELSRVRPSYKSLAEVATGMLHRREAHARAGLCPAGDVDLCRGSLVCAIAADDVDSMWDIMFAQRIAPGAQGIEGTTTIDDLYTAMERGPCYVFASLAEPNQVTAIIQDSDEVSLEGLAANASAPRALASLMPYVTEDTIMRGRLIRTAIRKMGRCIWICHLSPMAEIESGDLAERAASPIAWRGQPVAMPTALDEEEEEEEKDFARELALFREHGAISCNVVVYDASAIAGALLYRLSSDDRATLLSRLGWNPLNDLVDQVGGFAYDVVSWTWDYYRIPPEDRPQQAQFVRGLPSGYTDVLTNAEPFFLSPLPTNEREYSLFLDMLQAVRRQLRLDVTALTGWPDLLNTFLDAGFTPRSKLVRPGIFPGEWFVSTVWSRLVHKIKIHQEESVFRPLFVEAASTSPTLRPIAASWLIHPIVETILRQVDTIYTHRFGVP